MFLLEITKKGSQHSSYSLYSSQRKRRLEMAKKAPGKAHRDGLTLVQLMDMFPTEEAATAWFESVIWPDGRHCPKCGSERTGKASHAKMP